MMAGDEERKTGAAVLEAAETDIDDEVAIRQN